jgi:hypothetical protein
MNARTTVHRTDPTDHPHNADERVFVMLSFRVPSAERLQVGAVARRRLTTVVPM